MSRVIFGDTSGFYALAAEENERHEAATACLTSSMWLITSRFVIMETISLITKRMTPLDARLWYDRFIRSRTVSVREYDPSIYSEAERLWKRRQDKTWDLIDCYSFCLMQREGISEAMTFDSHFRQAGFKIIG